MLRISKRHLAKTFSWRFIATLDTLILAWIFAGNFIIGIQLISIELITKMFLYYFHERLWFKSNFKKSNMRQILKTFSWRAFGTLDTFIISWIITGNHIIGLKISLIEVVSKMIIYFFHEKIWYKINFGLDIRNRAARIKNAKKVL